VIGALVEEPDDDVDDVDAVVDVDEAEFPLEHPAARTGRATTAASSTLPIIRFTGIVPPS
jgi:hypothetical protein